MVIDKGAYTDTSLYRRESLKLLESISGGSSGGGGGVSWQLTQIVNNGASGVIKASPGALGAAIATNSHSTDQWLQLFDSTTAPSVEANPRLSVPLKANGGSYTLSQVLWGPSGLSFSSGVAWGISNTEELFTPGNQSVNLQFYWA